MCIRDRSKGTLVLNNGNVIENVLLQVDLYTNDIIASKDDGEIIYLDKRLFKEVIVSVDGTDVQYKKIDPKNPDDFYQVLYEDEGLVFFKERYASLREASNIGMTNTNARFINRTKYYIKHGEGQIAKVKLKKKEIFSGFVDAELYAMKEYARRKGIEFKDEADFIAVFEGVNEESAH